MFENNPETMPASHTFSEIEGFFSKPIPLTRPFFQPYPEDPVQAGIRRIRDVLSLKETASNVICMAGREQVDEWCSWLQSVVTNIAGRQFQDLFPPEAIAQYCDSHGKRLPGLRPVMKTGDNRPYWTYLMRRERSAVRMAETEPAVFWEHICPDDSSLAIEEQEAYLRFKAIPSAAFGLMSAFSNEALILQDETDELKAKLAELERQNRELQERCEVAEHGQDRPPERLETATAHSSGK